MKGTLSIRLDDELAEALQRAAREAGLSKGDIVRRAVAAHLKVRSGGSVMSRHFGTVSGPADLSTNKTYRRAWSRRAK